MTFLIQNQQGQQTEGVTYLSVIKIEFNVKRVNKPKPHECKSDV